MQSEAVLNLSRRDRKVSPLEEKNKFSTRRFAIPRDDSPNLGYGEHYKDLASKIQNLFNPTPPSLIGSSTERTNVGLQLFEATAVAKTLTSYVSMHLDDQWRKNIFFQLDLIHQVDEWDEDLSPVNKESMGTFLKTILKLKVKEYPGLGLNSKGHLVAAWTDVDKKLTLEFLPQDKVKWLISRKLIENENERAAGSTTVARLYQCLEPYELRGWFTSKS